MFSHAIDKVLKSIKPVVACKRLYNGKVTVDGATLILVNKDGWFLSAAHAFEVVPFHRKHLQEISEYEGKIAKLRRGTHLQDGSDTKLSKKELKGLRPNPEWITASSVWPGSDSTAIVDINVIPEADILLARLDPFDPATVTEYPVFKNPKTITGIGTSLCKIGFAFAELKVAYDKETNKFNLDFQNLVPFPLEGIYTRNIVFRSDEEKKIPIKFLETSSPGLRGQSGGPVFDREGKIWAIQSRTAHIPLGFNPKVKKDNIEVEENQFLNVSWAVHPDVLSQFMTERGVKFSVSD